MDVRSHSPRIALFAVCAAAACADVEPEAARRAWLVNTLIADNRPHIDRAPELVAAKLELMASGVNPYFRGSVRQYARDVSDPGGPVNAITRFGSAASSLVLLLGDPHPENIGSFRTDGDEIIAEYNDFDASTYGPYFFDVRRLALGFYAGGAAMEEATGIGEAVWLDAARAAAAGYAGEIESMSQGAAPFAMAASDNPIVEHMFEKAREDGDARDELESFTEVSGGRRRIVYGELDPVEGEISLDVVAEVSDAERAMIESVIARYAATVARSSAVAADQMAIKGVSRRFGAGVSSFALLRYYVLVEGPTDGVDDDVLLEVKEAGDALRFRDHPVLPARRFADNGERTALLQRAFQGRADADRFLGWASAGDLAFRVRDRTAYQRGIDIEKIAEEIVDEDWTPDDYVALAELAGRLLARCHALSETATGEPGLAAISAAIGGDVDGFIAETGAHVADYGPVILADHQRLVELLETRGALLGYRQ